MKLLVGRIKDYLRYRDLLKQLVSRDLKLKYRRSFLGYLWSILNPLLIMLVMVAVFSVMFKNNIENYPVYLLTGQTMFTFMRTATNQAMNSITGNSALLKKTYVPKYIFTVSKITSGLIDFVFSLGALIVVMLITKTKFSIYLVFLPVISLQLYVFSVGLGMFLAQASVFFRDLQYIYSVITTAWMYLTPMFYPIERLTEEMQWGIKNLNPMYFYITQFRSIALYGEIPSLSYAIKGTIAAVLFLILGIWSFKKTQDKFILYI